MATTTAWPTRSDAQQPVPFPFPQPTPKQDEPEEDRTRDFLFPLKLDWSTWLPDPPASWPAYDARHAYVPTRAGEVCAISLAEGQLQWCVEAQTAMPVVIGDRTIFVAGADGIYALETTIGDQRWRAPLETAFSAPLLWDSGWLVACLEDGGVAALRGDTGETIWRQTFEATCRSTPAIGGDQLFLPLEDGRLLAVQLTTGEAMWSQQLGGEVTEVLPLGERLYTGSVDNYFYALDGADGRILWRWRTGADIVGQPLVDQSRVFFVSRDNVVRALDRNHGAQRWKQPLELRPIWGPSMLDKTIVVSGLSPEIRGFTAEDGRPAGFFYAPTELAAPPHLADGETADDRRVYALTGNGEFLSLLHRIEPLLVPLEIIPGTAFPLPTSIGVLPGRRLGLPPRLTGGFYLPGPVGLPQPVEPVMIVGTPIGLPPAEHDLPGRALGFPPALPATTLPGRPQSFPPAPYWFEPPGVDRGFPPVPAPPEIRLPGQQLSLPPPPLTLPPQERADLDSTLPPTIGASRLPGLQLSRPEPPVAPPRIDLPGTQFPLPPTPPPPPVAAEPPADPAAADAPPDPAAVDAPPTDPPSADPDASPDPAANDPPTPEPVPPPP